VRSTHPNAIVGNYTYRGDTVRASFRDLNLPAQKTKRYRVCYRRNTYSVCERKRLFGSDWSGWRVKVGWRWAGWINGEYVGYLRFRWFVHGDRIATRKIRVYE
jgi:hypothetical protein